MEGPITTYVLKGIAESPRTNEKEKTCYKILFVKCKPNAWIVIKLNQDSPIGKGTIN